MGCRQEVLKSSDFPGGLEWFPWAGLCRYPRKMGEGPNLSSVADLRCPHQQEAKARARGVNSPHKWWNQSPTQGQSWEADWFPTIKETIDAGVRVEEDSLLINSRGIEPQGRHTGNLPLSTKNDRAHKETREWWPIYTERTLSGNCP